MNAAPAARHLRAAAVLAAIAAACAAIPAAASAASAASVSSNWAGYVALPSSGGTQFSSVYGAWTQPVATCTKGRETASAMWVGLGGYALTSRELEQIGTDSDCEADGATSYYAWLELLPESAVSVPIHLHAGDDMVASVTVRAHDVTLRLRDLSTGAHFSATRRARSIDRSSAEWIVEAPTECTGANDCGLLALTDFGQTSFTTATAIAGGRTEPIPGLRASAIDLHEDPADLVHGAGRPAYLRALHVSASTSEPPTAEGGFTVTWLQESAAAGEGEAPPTLPAG